MHGEPLRFLIEILRTAKMIAIIYAIAAIWAVGVVCAIARRIACK